ncbi:hypothetical protein [Bacillus sp. NPDC094106]|uniref:hypothetical protein n=1 Tax=Bacillus sp. NPDC094106 TaxID=3363949 RepID=UPI00381090D8
MCILSFVADVIAKRYMQWKEVERKFSEENWNPIRIYVDKDGQEMIEVHKFNPLKKEEQNFLILDELKKQHVDFTLESNAKLNSYTFKVYNKEKSIIHEQTHKDIMTVICLGAMALAGINISDELICALDIEANNKMNKNKTHNLFLHNSNNS